MFKTSEISISYPKKNISPSKLINIERLNSLYLNKNITDCLKEFNNVADINRLINIFQEENKVGLASLRSIFKDFNPIFQSEQIAFLEIEKATFPQNTFDICKSSAQRNRDYEKNWMNMCFYCGTPILPGQEKQCDHVIDILNTYVSIKPNEYFYRNFQFVHRKCNAKASNNNLTWIWNTIGDPYYFPPPLPNYNETNFCISNFLKSYNILTSENFFQYNSAICRYYLFENILKYLQPWSQPVFDIRIQSIKKIYTEYKIFLDKAKLNLDISPEINAANVLVKLPTRLNVLKTIKKTKRPTTQNKSRKKSFNTPDSKSNPANYPYLNSSH